MIEPDVLMRPALSSSATIDPSDLPIQSRRLPSGHIETRETSLNLSTRAIRSISPRTSGAENSPSRSANATAEFERLIALHYGRTYAQAYRLMGNAGDAEDMTQEAFLRAWVAFDRYDRSRPFEGWLFRILSNLAIDGWRRRSALTTCSLDAAGTGGRNPAAPEGRRASLAACLPDQRRSVMPEPAYLRRETAHRVRRALGAMPVDYRTAVLLADVEGRSYEEIASHVGCPVGTVRSRLHRGRRMLRNNILHLQRQEESRQHM
jgi:RNA polymerase sigma-70 factor (ECF subfamily)